MPDLGDGLGDGLNDGLDTLTISGIPLENLITPLTVKIRGSGKWTAGDTAPPYYAILSDQTGNTLLLGTIITAELRLRDTNTGETALVVDVNTTNLGNSVVEYRWSTGDLVEGVYDQAIKLVDSIGNILTFRGTTQIIVAKEF